MSKKNQELIGWLQKAHQACKTRLEKINQEQLLPDDRLSALQKEMQQVFDDFNLPELWIVPVDYSGEQKALLLEHIVNLQHTGPAKPEEFEQQTKSLIEFLRGHILPLAKAWADAADTSAWNRQMRDELLRMRKTLRQVKNKFDDQGHDLDNNAAFSAADERFHELMGIYWQKLIGNEVNTNEDQIALMSGLRAYILTLAAVPKFIKAYQQINAVITENCGLPA